MCCDNSHEMKSKFAGALKLLNGLQKSDEALCNPNADFRCVGDVQVTKAIS